MSVYIQGNVNIGGTKQGCLEVTEGYCQKSYVLEVS